VGEHCSNPQSFKEKNYKAKFSTSSKINKYNLKKIIKNKKNHVEKHCSNPQCFARKTTAEILNQLNIKKNQIDK
jgi:hypothetical protein